MSIIKIYTPVYKPSKGNGCWFTVNGASSTNKSTAINNGNQHTSVKDRSAVLARIDIEEVHDFDYYRKAI